MRSFHQDQLEEGAGISCCCLRGGKGIRKDADVLQVSTTLQLYEVFFFYLDGKEKALVLLRQPVFCRELDAKVGHNTEVLNTMKISPSKLSHIPVPPTYTHTISTSPYRS